MSGGPVIARQPMVDAKNVVTRPWLLFFQGLASGSFQSITITGDGTITATGPGQTLTLTAGPGITLTSDPVTATITISADGGRFGNDFLLMGS